MTQTVLFLVKLELLGWGEVEVAEEDEPGEVIFLSALRHLGRSDE